MGITNKGMPFIEGWLLMWLLLSVSSDVKMCMFNAIFISVGLCSVESLFRLFLRNERTVDLKKEMA